MMSERKVKYLLDEIQPGETHFVKGSTKHAVQSYLSHVRRKHGVAVDAVIRAVDSRAGVIIRREQ